MAHKGLKDDTPIARLDLSAISLSSASTVKDSSNTISPFQHTLATCLPVPAMTTAGGTSAGNTQPCTPRSTCQVPKVRRQHRATESFGNTPRDSGVSTPSLTPRSLALHVAYSLSPRGANIGRHGVGATGAGSDENDRTRGGRQPPPTTPRDVLLDRKTSSAAERHFCEPHSLTLPKSAERQCEADSPRAGPLSETQHSRHHTERGCGATVAHSKPFVPRLLFISTAADQARRKASSGRLSNILWSSSDSSEASGSDVDEPHASHRSKAQPATNSPQAPPPTRSAKGSSREHRHGLQRSAEPLAGRALALDQRITQNRRWWSKLDWMTKDASAKCPSTLNSPRHLSTYPHTNAYSGSANMPLSARSTRSLSGFSSHSAAASLPSSRPRPGNASRAGHAPVTSARRFQDGRGVSESWGHRGGDDFLTPRTRSLKRFCAMFPDMEMGRPPSEPPMPVSPVLLGGGSAATTSVSPKISNMCMDCGLTIVTLAADMDNDLAVCVCRNETLPSGSECQQPDSQKRGHDHVGCGSPVVSLPVPLPLPPADTGTPTISSQTSLLLPLPLTVPHREASCEEEEVKVAEGLNDDAEREGEDLESLFRQRKEHRERLKKEQVQRRLSEEANQQEEEQETVVAAAEAAKTAAECRQRTEPEKREKEKEEREGVKVESEREAAAAKRREDSLRLAADEAERRAAVVTAALRVEQDEVGETGAGEVSLLVNDIIREAKEEEARLLMEYAVAAREKADEQRESQCRRTAEEGLADQLEDQSQTQMPQLPLLTLQTKVASPAWQAVRTSWLQTTPSSSMNTTNTTIESSAVLDCSSPPQALPDQDLEREECHTHALTVSSIVTSDLASKQSNHKDGCDSEVAQAAAEATQAIVAAAIRAMTTHEENDDAQEHHGPDAAKAPQLQIDSSGENSTADILYNVIPSLEETDVPLETALITALSDAGQVQFGGRTNSVDTVSELSIDDCDYVGGVSAEGIVSGAAPWGLSASHSSPCSPSLCSKGVPPREAPFLGVSSLPKNRSGTLACELSQIADSVGCLIRGAFGKEDGVMEAQAGEQKERSPTRRKVGTKLRPKGTPADGAASVREWMALVPGAVQLESSAETSGMENGCVREWMRTTLSGRGQATRAWGTLPETTLPSQLTPRQNHAKMTSRTTAGPRAGLSKGRPPLHPSNQREWTF